MKNLMIILMVTTLLACDDSNDSEKDNFNLYAGLEFSVFNSENEDLLNPENANHLDVDNIRLFYVINGQQEEVYDPNLTYPRNFTIFEHENEYRIGVSLNTSETSDKPITYIQWNDQDTDTIEVVYKRTPNAIIQDTIWLNGEQVWELGDNTIDPYFKLIK